MARYDFATHRLFVEGNYVEDAIIPLDPSQMNYLVNVLRMDEGAKLLAFNGRDGEWRAELVKPNRKTAVLKLIARVRPQQPPGAIRYAFAPLKSARLDYIIQKAVEMGVGTITPVVTQRTQMTRLKPERLLANAIEAAEQCGVLAIPVIEDELKLIPFLRALDADDLIVFCDEDAEIADPVAALRACGQPPRITVLIGPECGFTEEERDKILAHPRICRLSLGPRILRADTAAVAAFALVQAVMGDWTGATN